MILVKYNILIVVAIIIIACQISTSIPIPLDTDEADIVIVGGGTSACIIAYRLAQKYPTKSRTRT